MRSVLDQTLRKANMIPLSDNHYSTDIQLADVVGLLDPDEQARFLEAFPEWPRLAWSGSWVDTEASGVDPEYTSWCIDWIEANTQVSWREGEPFLFENGDDDDEDGWL